MIQNADSVNSLALTKQHKHINMVFIRLLIKYVIQQEEKIPSLFSVSKLLLQTWRKTLHHIMFWWPYCSLGLWGYLELTCLHQKVRLTGRGFFLCLTKFVESDRELTWNQMAKWGLWWLFHSKGSKHIQRMIIQMCGPHGYAVYPVSRQFKNGSRWGSWT